MILKMEEFNELLRKMMTRRGPRREPALANLRAFVQDLLGHEGEIQHLRYENKAQWHTIREILTDKKAQGKELYELKKELQELKKLLELKKS